MTTWQPVMEQVMRERSARLLAYARLLTGDAAEAEDVLQDALVRAFSRGRTFSNVNQAEAYVRRAIPSVFIDRLRSRKSAWRLHVRMNEPAPRMVDLDAVMDVRAALAQLPPRERACVVLRFYDDLTVAKIAERLGLAEGSVKRYLSDASAKLATMLDSVPDWRDTQDSVPVQAPTVQGDRS